MKKFWFKRGLMFVAFFIVAILFFGTIVMVLWNTILPVVLGVKAITFFQALGILLLSKILFGGFRGGCRSHYGHDWKHKMKDKWDAMTPEERERLKSEWKSRCGGRWRMQQQDTPAAE